MSPVRVRPDLAEVPAYRPGRALQQPVVSGASFKCSSNENPHPPLPGVLEAIAAAAEQVNRYPDLTSGRLSAALAARLDVPVEQVVCGPGSVGVLQQLVTALAGPGDEVVFAWRSFEAYPIVTRVAGARPVAVPLAPGGRHDVDAMLAAVTDRTRLVLVCTPNNPTGPAVTVEELDRLVAGVPDDMLVVVDEAYAEFVREPAAANGLDALRRYSNVAVLRTFSKAYGLAGLRVGYGVAPEPVATALRKTSIPFAVSAIAEAAALASLEQEPVLLERVDRLVAERDRVLSRLADLGWDVPDSQANFVWFGVGRHAEKLAETCEAGGLSVRTFPGEGVRVTIAEPAANALLLQAAAAVPHLASPAPPAPSPAPPPR